jgi:hypothetical protein
MLQLQLGVPHGSTPTRIGPLSLLRRGARGHFNFWADEHDRGNLAGCPVLVLMDVFEHPYMAGYGTKRGESIDARVPELVRGTCVASSKAGGFKWIKFTVQPSRTR